MQWDVVTSIATVVSSIAVIASVVYLAVQVRLNSAQIAQNSRFIEASVYHSTNEAFLNWYSLMAQDGDLAAIWQRVIRSGEINEFEKARLHAFLAMLFLAYEANFQQLKLSVISRQSLKTPAFRFLLRLPAIAGWWQEHGPRVFTPEFQEAVERERAGAHLWKESRERSS